MTAKAKPPPPPWRSGFCGLTNPRWSHDRCAREWNGRPCVCDCHRPAPEEPTMTAEPGPEALAPSIAPAPHPYDFGLPDMVRLLEDVTTTLTETARTRDVEALDWQDAVRVLDRLRDVVWKIGTVQDSLTRHAYLTGEHGDVDVEGVGRVKIARGRDRRQWDGRAVARAVIDQKMEDLGGETPDPWDVAEWLLEVIAADRCRVTPLREMGLEPAAFCEDTPGKIGVSLPPRR